MNTHVGSAHQLARVVLLRKAVKDIVNILAGEGIKVQSSGLTAYVEVDPSTGIPTLVNIPMLPDDCSQQTLDTVIGFMDREVAKLLFSDFKVRQLAHGNGKTFGQLFDVIDAIQTDERFQHRYRGAVTTMRSMFDFYLTRHVDDRLKIAIEDENTQGAVTALFVPMFRALAGRPQAQAYMDAGDKWQHVNGFLFHIPDELKARIKTVNNSLAAFDLTRDILECFQGDESGEDSDGKGDSSSDSGDSDTGSEDDSGEPSGDDASAPSKSDPKPESDTPDSEESEPESSDDDENDGDTESAPETGDESSDDDESGDDSASSEAETKPEGHDDENDGDTESAPDAAPETGDESSDDEGSGASMELAEMPDAKAEKSDEPPPAFDGFFNTGEFDMSASQCLSRELTSGSGDAKYLPYSTDFDVERMHKLSPRFKQHCLDRMDSAVSDMVGPMSTTLQRVFTARSQTRWRSGMKSGRYHQKKATRVLMGDDKVMRRRQSSEITNNVAVSLVVDLSGSMTGAPIQIAMTAAMGLARVLERLKVKCEVSGFTTYRNGELEKMISQHESGSDSHRNWRREALNLPIFKSFQDRLTHVQEELMADAAFGGVRLANNVDGESVQRAAIRLVAQNPKADKHMMIVLSDGEPAAHGDMHAMEEHLKEVVQASMAAGIHTVGIGIQTEAVRHFYPNHVVLEDIDKLPEVVVGELRSMLLAP